LVVLELDVDVLDEDGLDVDVLDEEEPPQAAKPTAIRINPIISADLIGSPPC
jgi:hypothetical protein